MNKSIIKDDNGMTTLEVVIIAAVLIGIALIFRKQIFSLFSGMLDQITGTVDEIDLISPDK